MNEMNKNKPANRNTIAAVAQILACERSTLEEWCRAVGQPYYEISQSSQAHSLLTLLPGPGDKKGSAIPFPYERPTLFSGHVVDAKSIPEEGFIVTQDKRIIYEGLGGRNYDPVCDLGTYCQNRTDDCFMLNLGNEFHVVQEECIFFGGRKNFGHFIFQNLLRLMSLQWLSDLNLRSLPIAVYEGLPDRFFQFLDLIGFTSDKRILIPRDKVTHFESVWLLSSSMGRRTADGVFIWQEAIWALRQKVGHLMRTLKGQRPRYFLYRGDANWRRLVNESDLSKVLETYRIQPIDLSTLPATEQIRTISNAEIIVVELGAAGGISVFSPPDCAIIELSPPGVGGALGPIAFAMILGQAFNRIYGRPASIEEINSNGLSAPISDDPVDRDYFIAPEILDFILSSAETHLRRN